MTTAATEPTFLIDDDTFVVTALATPVEAVAELVPRTAGGPTGWAAVAKRAVDVVGAVVLLALVVPAVLLGAFGVWATSGQPAVFRQVRVGREGRPFTMLKLRTYPVDHVDDHFSEPISACPTRWGRFLRRTSVDELPQLWNVLRGDMSLVGPRPERPHFAVPLAQTVDGYRDRHRVKMGITGLAQVRGQWGNSSIEDRVASDNEYIERWSFGLDLRILVRTLVAVVVKTRH